MNYQVCLRHMKKNDNVILLWGENNCGYSKAIEIAGLYSDTETPKQLQIERGDFLVPKETVESLMKKVRLPVYGDEAEKYGGLNEFHVLPNTGEVRRALGFTTLNIVHEGTYNLFDAYFKDDVKEVYKYEYSKTHYIVKIKKDAIDEWWHYDGQEFEAKTRNEAIEKARKEWFFDESYIEFKSMVTCSRSRKLVFSHWSDEEDGKAT